MNREYKLPEVLYKLLAEQKLKELGMMNILKGGEIRK